MTRTSRLPLRSCRIRNFKAIRHSGLIRFTPLTVFIGNNGSGKSSLIEALEALKAIVLDGVDSAMKPWHGFENAWNRAVRHRVGLAMRAAEVGRVCIHPMHLYVSGRVGGRRLRATLEVTAKDDQYEQVVGSYHSALDTAKFAPHPDYLMSDLRVRQQALTDMVSGWQFLSMVPQAMTEPRLKRRAGNRPALTRDGANVAEYLQDIHDRDPSALAGIVEAMRHVLPYAEDIRPRVTSGVEKKVYLELAEHGFRDKLPSWLFSTGTIRILALLAVLRNPQPPSVLFVEEIENGLDPQTIHLLIEELRAFVQSGGGQVVLTTHSPYLLDLLPLSSLILVERDERGAPVFTRPADQESLAEWAKAFAPGKLYTMGGLGRGGQRP